MNMNTILYRAAEQIEQFPKHFDFMETNIPPDCGAPGCALGWIGHFAVKEGWEGNRAGVYGGIYHREDSYENVLPLMKLEDPTDLYDELAKLAGRDWRFDGATCAKALRMYADKHYPVNDHIPATVRQIFDPEAETVMF